MQYALQHKSLQEYNLYYFIKKKKKGKSLDPVQADYYSCMEFVSSR